MRLRTLGLASLAIALFATTAGAGPIVQDLGSGVDQILYHSPAGQSFIAEDAHVSIGFFIEDLNPDEAPDDDDVSITLRVGEGTGGAVLGSGAVTGLTFGFQGWADVDFSSVALTVGQVYTAVISDDTARWGVRLSGLNPYAGGQAYSLGSAIPTVDARFRVLPQSLPVPDAGSTMLLLGPAIATLLVLRRARVF